MLFGDDYCGKIITRFSDLTLCINNGSSEHEFIEYCDVDEGNKSKHYWCIFNDRPICAFKNIALRRKAAFNLFILSKVVLVLIRSIHDCVIHWPTHCKYVSISVRYQKQIWCSVN